LMNPLISHYHLRCGYDVANEFGVMCLLGAGKVIPN
jgi:hypothetical protein